MQPAVYGPGRRVRRIGAVHGVWTAPVEQKQISRLDEREMHPARVHKKDLATRGYRDAEMIADRFMPVELGGEAKGRRQIDAQLALAVIDVAGRDGCLKRHFLPRT